MYPTELEVLTALQAHVTSSPTFVNREHFLDILRDVQNNLLSQEHNHTMIRCINLEGFDGVGKTTLSGKLAQYPDFSIFPTLSIDLRPFRSYFDEQTEDVKRKYYQLNNIIASRKLASSSDRTIWILDRYWPSTIAYQLAHQSHVDLESLPNPLPWPTYIRRPSYVVYLYLDEVKRQERIAKRNLHQAIDPEEQQLAADHIFRERLDAIYRRIENIQLVDANRSIDEIIEIILQGFKNSPIGIS